MGVLPGWWLGESDGRSEQPYMSPDRWNIELQKAGFAGVDAAIYDEETPYHQNANIISHPAKLVNRAPRITFLIPKTNLAPEIKFLEKEFKGLGYDIDVHTLHDALPKDQPIISFLELCNPFFSQIAGEDFALFQNLTRSIGPSGLLWITRSAQRDVTDPRFGMTLGLARSLRNELSILLATFELDSLNDSALRSITAVFEKFQTRTETLDVGSDFEFVLEKGVVKVGRFQPVSVLEELIVEPKEAGAMQLDIGKFGLLQTLQWKRSVPEEPSPDCVAIEPRCAGLNFKVCFPCGDVDYY